MMLIKWPVDILMNYDVLLLCNVFDQVYTWLHHEAITDHHFEWILEETDQDLMCVILHSQSPLQLWRQGFPLITDK